MSLESIEAKMAVLGPFSAPREEIDIFHPMDFEDVSRIEELTGPLPEVYTKYLTKYGASRCLSSIGIRLLEPFQGGHVFFGVIFGHDKCYGLLDEWETYRGRMPSTFLPIAEDSGNKVCMELSPNNYGKVYYWDHNNEADPESYAEYFGLPMPHHLFYQNVYLVANSFEEMWQQMFVIEDWEPPVGPTVLESGTND
jgi:hypothetical protein